MPRYEEYLFLQQQAQQGDPIAIQAFQATTQHYRDPLMRGDVQAPAADLRVALAQADTLVHHPGWQFFLNALQARVEAKQAEIDKWMKRLMESESPESRRRICELKGELTGLKFAATLVPQLVDMGAAVRAATADTSESTTHAAPPDAAVSGAHQKEVHHG